MARRRRRNFSGGRPARPVEWLRGQTSITSIPGAAGVVVAAVFDLSAGFAGFAAAISPTVVRIRGMLTLSAEFAGPPVLLPWAAGFCKISLKAIAAGITAVPIPAVDDADWQWYLGGALGDSAAGTTPEEDTHHIEVDSKAMRRYEQDDEHFAFVIANHSGLAGDDLNMHLSFSYLVKE